MSTTQGAFSASMPLPPPPADLGSYARTMHQHTKRQMESISAQSSPRGSGSQQGGQSAPTGLPDGVSSRNRNSSQYS